MPAESQSARLARASAVEAPEIPDHELLCQIGRGAYGEVWMARNALGTLRAVKVVYRWSFEHTEHFEREFKGLLKFEPISRCHEGLVDILQIGRRDDAGYFYYVMELADAAQLRSDWPSALLDTQAYHPRTVRAELQAYGRLPPAQCVRLGLKLAAALDYLHEQGLIHRDIKPSNIIFVNGEPKLADIGLVTAIDEAHSLVGTVGYIPPEGPGTPQADLYSLGKVLYEAALGKERHEFPQWPPDLESHSDYAALLELNEIILKACESDPRARYESGRQMQTDLAHLEHGGSVRQARTRQRYWAFGWRACIAIAAVAVVPLMLTFVKGLKSGYTPDPETARLYANGKWYYSQLTPGDHAKAFTNLTQAIQRNPRFVRPYGELTMLYVWRIFGDVSNDETLRGTKEIAGKLAVIDPHAAERHVALSWWCFLERDWKGAEREILLAIKVDPQLAIAYDVYCFYLSVQGRTEEAQVVGQRAQALEPPSSARVTALVAAWPSITARRFDRAIEQLRKCLDLDSNFPLGHHYLGKCYEAQSNYVAALVELKTFELSSGGDRARVERQYAALREAYDREGQAGYFRKWIEKIHEDEAAGQEVFEQVAAGYYAMLGDKENALVQLEREFDQFGIWQVLKFEPHYDPLHREPRFQALLQRAGLEP